MKVYFCGVVVLVFACNGASAEIVKCVDADGKVEYKQSPCTGLSKDVTPKSVNSLSIGNSERNKNHNGKRDQFHGEQITLNFQMIGLKVNGP